MELTEIQKQTVAQWVGEGAGLSDIQRRLSDEFDVSMTYMDVRFLIIDLGLSLQDGPEQQSASDAADAAEADDVAPDAPPPPESGLGGVSVELDRVQHPGTLVSGTVVFSDGMRATWAIDPMQRFMLQPEQEGYQPAEADMQAFQIELQKALGARGL